VLRDWARLGLMLANRGDWQGKTIVPESWLTSSAANALPTDSPLAKYGYQIWYSADTKRFGLRGLRGQFVFVDPELKLVLVQTALDGNQPGTAEVFALWSALRTQVQQAAIRIEPSRLCLHRSSPFDANKAAMSVAGPERTQVDARWAV
jgi:CubicO group peptidase (beta-lactamase class C family)